jgi:hypothetical protein
MPPGTGNLDIALLTRSILVEPGTEDLIVGPLTFHDLALIISGGCAIIAIFLSLYLAFMHAINYTKPNEQRQYASHPVRSALMQSLANF